MKARVLGATVAVLMMLTAAGCGGSSHDDTARKSLASDLHQSGSSKISLSTKESDCVAGKMVKKPGVEKLKKAGILGKDYKVKNNVSSVKMSKTDADATADAIVDCTDAKQIFLKALKSSGTTLPAAMSSCIQSKITESDVHDLLSSTFQGETSASSALTSKLQSCATAGS